MSFTISHTKQLSSSNVVSINILATLSHDNPPNLKMTSYFQDPDSRSWELPTHYSSEDVRLSEDVLERYINKFTKVGDTIFDPFAGFGTTLVVAERLGRKGLGFEILSDRASYANSLLQESEVKTADIRTASLNGIKADLVIFSPPYMNKTDLENPLDAYASPVESYTQFILDLTNVCRKASEVLAQDARMIVQLQNLRNESGHTPLAFDLHHAIGESLDFLGEEVTLWEEDYYGYNHGYCLMYGRP